MTTNTIWNGSLPGGTSSVSTGSRTDGIQFDITASGCQITAIGFYVPSTETNLTGSNYTALLYTTVSGTTGTLVTSQPGAGTFTAGAWNWITLSSPVALSTGVHYVAAVTSPDLIQFLSGYWNAGNPGSGGLISGPISVPDAASAPGNVQQGKLSTGAGFPGSSTGTWFGVDIQVTTSGGTAHTATAAVTVTPATATTKGTGRRQALAVTPATATTKGTGRRQALAVTPATATTTAGGQKRGGYQIVPALAAAGVI